MLVKKILILEHKKFFRYKSDRGLRNICKSCKNYPTDVTFICPGCYKIEGGLSIYGNLKGYSYNKYQLSY